MTWATEAEYIQLVDYYCGRSGLCQLPNIYAYLPSPTALILSSQLPACRAKAWTPLRWIRRKAASPSARRPSRPRRQPLGQPEPLRMTRRQPDLRMTRSIGLSTNEGLSGVLISMSRTMAAGAANNKGFAGRFCLITSVIHYEPLEAFSLALSNECARLWRQRPGYTIVADRLVSTC